MESIVHFDEILDDVEKLSLEEQETLIDILNRRVIDRRRLELAKEIQEAQKEFQEGSVKTVTPDELMREILS
jgi:hypothetical protein